jgi:hypothetical protein
MVVFDLVGGALGSAVDFLGSVVDVVVENPIKSVAIGVATVATGGTALAFAGPIAGAVGATGLLGAAGTGTAISSLTGVALTKASLAALGGGTLAAGGGGMAAGTMVIAAGGAAVGGGVAGGIAAATS